eukprot:m.358044 g.358044  ORF g.358044 m.358044 type:complete len:75 (-) comp18021_c0_seq1:1426-1650(-)
MNTLQSTPYTYVCMWTHIIIIPSAVFKKNREGESITRQATLIAVTLGWWVVLINNWKLNLLAIWTTTMATIIST